MSFQWNPTLRDQLDLHWDHQVRPRYDGLTDEEYLWEPVPGCWSLRPALASSDSGNARQAELSLDLGPTTTPAPFTTIAWRLSHLIVGVLAARNASHFGRARVDYQTHTYATSAREALRQLDEELAHWREGVSALGEDGLSRPMGASEGPYAHRPFADLVLHINREMLHHGAEIALLRDLYLHTSGDIRKLQES